MSTYKTQVEAETLRLFFARHKSADEQSLETIEGGEVSQAYFFNSQEGPRVLRINQHKEDGFRKDRLAHEHFSSDLVPVPAIIEIGTLANGTYYAVSERVSGKTLDKFSSKEIATLMPTVFRTLDAIHQTEPIGEGYGFLDMDGKGQSSSWHEALEAEQEDRDRKDKPTDTPFFEQQTYKHVRKVIKQYYRYCPSDICRLIHKDYGFGNTLCDGQHITGVIDWQSVSYGDPMYDVAWLDFWAPKQGWAATIRQYYIEGNRLPEHFDERLACYQLIIAANCMSFFAKSHQEDKYNWVRDQALAIEGSV
jgi:aminoglycoside phosphotransferase (APT) family kinase protein